MSTHGRSTRRFKLLARNLRAAGHQCFNYPACDGIDYTAPAGHPRAFTVDHIIPLSIDPSGAEDPANLRAACHSCNASRGTGKPTSPVSAVSTAVALSHNYSPTAGSITTRDWSGDWSRNHWHRANPSAPCPCRPTPVPERRYSP